MLNWTIEVGFYGIGALGIGFAFGIIFYQLHKGIRYRYFYFSATVWFSMFCATVFWGLANLLMSQILFTIGFYWMIPATLLLLLKSDSISRDTIDPIKILIFAVLATLYILNLIKPANIIEKTYPNGEVGLTYTVSLQLTFGLMAMMPNVVYLYLLIRMNIQSPKAVRRYSFLYLSGLVVFSFISLILTFGIAYIIPGIHNLAFAIGAVMMAITVARNPILPFILPFKAIRLTVLETNSGIPLFTYNWVKNLKEGEEELYAGMLQGVNLIIKESLNRGEVQEIRVSSAILLSYRSKQYPIACILASTKSSKTLRDGLQIFAEKFIKTYSTYFPTYQDVRQFASAGDLISKSFPYIPEYL